MRKLRIFFPRVEAGMGHIMTCDAVCEEFEKRYGDKFEILHFNFYKHAKTKNLHNYGEMLKSQVRLYTSHPKIGHLVSTAGETVSPRVASFVSIRAINPNSFKEGVMFMEEIRPDVIFSTHWATNYYAEHMDRKPFTIMYCPDATLNKPFSYRTDLRLISMEPGYETALNDPNLDTSNLRLVPFCIRNSAYLMKKTTVESREYLGIDKDAFVVCFAEGGYGNGNMRKIVELLLEEDLPMTITAICGKNEQLFEYFKTLKSKGKLKFIPVGFTTEIFEYLNACDIFCGKSGNMIAEPTFFGKPSIITSTSTEIETHIGSYYSDYVGSAMEEFDPKKVVKMLKDFYSHREKLTPYIEKAKNHHESYGAKVTAKLIYEEILKRWPELEEEDDNV